MSTYNVITYGCQMNEHDSENISGFLEALGYEYHDDPFTSDLVVMNTCSVRENADKRFFGVLGQFKNIKKRNPDFILCVCGCMPQQERIQKKIRQQFNWVDVLFGTQNIARFPEMLEKRIKTGKKQVQIVANNPTIDEDRMTAKRMYKHKALVNITYGCNNFCTYCIVPYTRGREKSRMMDDVLAEIRCLVADGVKEVMLLGQNVDSYRDAVGNNFAMLIKAVNEIDGLERIRFMTSHPKDISDEMIDCYRTCDKLCKYIHLPVQSGSDAVLKRMNRHYDTARYMDIITKLRATVPDIAISTDIIVGFPGETEEQFEETLEIARKVQYDSAFTFIYSPREGTPAAGFEDQIPESVKHERFNRLVEVINDSSLSKASQYLDRTVKVMVEGTSKNDDSTFSGRTDDFRLVNFKSEKSIDDLIGNIVNVHITDAKTFSLDGIEVE